MSNLTEIPIGLKEEWSNFLLSVLREESNWAQSIFVTLLVIIFITGILGNLLTCIVIYCEKSMHTATNFYLFDLAVSDFFVSFAILLEIHEHLSDSYQFGDLFCKIHFFLVVVLWNNSILIMTALSIERYIAIWHPLLLNSTPVWRRVMKVICFLWVVAILEAMPELWSIELVKTKFPKTSICFTMPTNFARICNGVQALLTFVIPLIVMIFVYSMIAFKVNSNEKSNSKDKVFNHRDHRGKVNKLIALTVSFLVCWLPFFTMRVITCAVHMRTLMTSLKQWWGVAFKFVSFNSWFSIVLNPLLFSLMSTKFRKALKALWTNRFKRRKPRSIFMCKTGTV